MTNWQSSCKSVYSKCCEYIWKQEKDSESRDLYQATHFPGYSYALNNFVLVHVGGAGVLGSSLPLMKIVEPKNNSKFTSASNTIYRQVNWLYNQSPLTFAPQKIMVNVYFQKN